MVLSHFQAGLMQIGDKEATLYQTGEQTDPGGVRGNPARAALTVGKPAKHSSPYKTAIA